MIRVRDGDIFNFATLQKIQELDAAVNRLPGVDHQQVFSLASHRVAYVQAVPGAIETKNFMFPKVPRTASELTQLKRLVLVQRAFLRNLVSTDNRSAVVVASFNEQRLDYSVLFQGIQASVARLQDRKHTIYVAGEPVVRGYGYYYLRTIAAICIAAIGSMIAVLYLTLGARTTWWVPIVTGSFSAVYGLGFMGLVGYDFDPVMLVIPFILTARDFSHGIQWQGRYYDELDRCNDKHRACVETTAVMLPPGFLAILADIAGIIFVSFGGIPLLQHIALAGAIWLAASLTMVFIFQPILMSYLPVPRMRHRSKSHEGALHENLRRLVHRLVKIPVTRGPARSALLWAGVLIIVWGVVSGARAEIGYSFVGTPLYRPNAKVNQDIQLIGRYFPLDEGWVVLTGPSYPAPQCVLDPRVLRLADRLRTFMLPDPNVLAVVSFASSVVKPFNQMFHYAYPKYLSVPPTREGAANLWSLFMLGSAPGDMERYFSTHEGKDTCIRLLLKDHTYASLNEIRGRLDNFVHQNVSGDPGLNQVKLYYLSGMAGLYAAANDVLYQLDLVNLTFVLGVIFIFCAISFRSLAAGFLFFLSCVLANFAAFIYMRFRDIGLTIDTIPVISLGIGLGVDYGIYMVARIRDEVIDGRELADAITTALNTTGGAVLSTFAVMVSGILFWAFSPVLFHNQMSVLLMLLMVANMLAGTLVLPAAIAWLRPQFICRFETGRQPVAAGEDTVAQMRRAGN
jgi:predicted RND superfamily exporter protein